MKEHRKVNIVPGANIENALRDVIMMSKLNEGWIAFRFNGLLIVVNKDSILEDELNLYRKLKPDAGDIQTDPCSWTDPLYFF